jgi:hypothetical protein
MEAALLIINHLRTRAHGAHGLPRLVISAAAVRCLLQNWSTAEQAGVRFHAEGVDLEGVEFRLRWRVQPEIRAALRSRRTASATSGHQSAGYAAGA